MDRVINVLAWVGENWYKLILVAQIWQKSFQRGRLVARKKTVQQLEAEAKRLEAEIKVEKLKKEKEKLKK